MITKEQLERFKLIYKKEFNKEISNQEVLGQAINLLRLADIVYKNMIDSKYENQ
jgi:hypothetical protein